MAGDEDIFQPLLGMADVETATNAPQHPFYGSSQYSDRSEGLLGERSTPPAGSPALRPGAGGGLPPERSIKPVRSMKRTGTGLARARRLTWICIDDEGKRTYMQADKRALITNAKLNIPIRDMRLLDFNLVQADSTILVRDNAIIASLEHARMIITADKAYLPREGVEHNPLAARFVDVLEEAVLEWVRQRREFIWHLEEEMGMGSVPEGRKVPRSDAPATETDETSSMGTSGMRLETQPLPFELVVLEAALKEIIASITLQTKELEGVALPALDVLTKSVSSANLERVRKVKTRLQRLTLRCEAVRDELQRFLQDDEDMGRMCLSRRKEAEEEMARAASSGDVDGPAGHEVTPHFHPGSLVRRNINLARHSMGLGDTGEAGGHDTTPTMPGNLVRRSMNLARHSIGFGGANSPPRAVSALPSREAFANAMGPSAAALEEEADAEAQQEVENLLESYYMQVDSMYDKLVSVGEYIKDTEEYINIGEGEMCDADKFNYARSRRGAVGTSFCARSETFSLDYTWLLCVLS